MMDDHDEFDEAELQALRERARLLPRDIPPAPESWVNIRNRIEHSRVRELVPTALAESERDQHATDFAARRLSTQRTRIALAVAAVLFIAVTTFVVARDGGDEQSNNVVVATSELARPVNVPASPSMDAVLAQYDQATADLTNDLEQRRARLQPEAVAVIDSCLTTINRAIKESRTALVDAPDNATIVELLQLTYQQKIDLLRRAADLPLGSL